MDAGGRSGQGWRSWADRRARAVTAEVLDTVLVQYHAKAWQRGQGEVEVLVFERLCEDLFGQQQSFVVDIVNAALTCWGTSTYDWLQRSMNGYQ